MSMFYESSTQLVFFFNDTATTEIYTLSLHDALPIYSPCRAVDAVEPAIDGGRAGPKLRDRCPKGHGTPRWTGCEDMPRSRWWYFIPSSIAIRPRTSASFARPFKRPTDFTTW